MNRSVLDLIGKQLNSCLALPPLWHTASITSTFFFLFSWKTNKQGKPEQISLFSSLPNQPTLDAMNMRFGPHSLKVFRVLPITKSPPGHLYLNLLGAPFSPSIRGWTWLTQKGMVTLDRVEPSHKGAKSLMPKRWQHVNVSSHCFMVFLFLIFCHLN